MIEDVARVVDVEKVLRRLDEGGLRVLLEVGQHVLQEVGVRLHVRVEDHDDVIVLGRLLGEYEELERRVDVARLAVNRHAWELVPERRRAPWRA